MGEIKLLNERVIQKVPLQIEYIFLNSFPRYEELEIAMSEITPKKSIDILNWKNEDATHEMVAVDEDTITMMYREV